MVTDCGTDAVKGAGGAGMGAGAGADARGAGAGIGWCLGARSGTQSGCAVAGVHTALRTQSPRESRTGTALPLIQLLLAMT